MIASDPPGRRGRPVTRRRALLTAGAAVAAPFLAGGPHPADAADYPPTAGAMQGFVLLKRRRPASDAPFFDADGAVRHFSDFRGRTLLVNFWATWCAPCIKEMPYLAALQDDLGGPDFTVLAISQDRGGPEVAEPFVRDRLGLPALPLYYDPKLTLGRDMGVRGLPTTFAVDKRGRTVGYLAGLADWSGPDAKALLRHLTAEDEAAPLEEA
ncbi:MAG: TlpA disulfide reductase family protein [Marivibrio sp.]|uniref:TlpA family protein disulfide reductase n=1 Tax=Marivibrio sp. TaxID=2039719 RepID=UPI0032EBA722